MKGWKKTFKNLEDKEYFTTRIANNRFYGLSKEFAVVSYTVPKSSLGLRRYKFMTCPMRVLYSTLLEFIYWNFLKAISEKEIIFTNTFVRAMAEI